MRPLPEVRRPGKPTGSLGLPAKPSAPP